MNDQDAVRLLIRVGITLGVTLCWRMQPSAPAGRMLAARRVIRTSAMPDFKVWSRAEFLQGSRR
jgi:hypothetical protein